MKRTILAATLGVGALGFWGSSNAATIDWVVFSGWPDASLSQSGLSSADGLTLDATFTAGSGNLRATFPKYLGLTLDDLAWPFTNSAISSVFEISGLGTGPLVNQLTFEFDSPGLPVGGSIALVDLEDPASSVKFVGLQDDGIGGFTEVAVNWSVAYYQTLGVDILPPDWDATTNTATGTVGSFNPGVNNFTFLITDVRLDALRMEINIADGDGIQFGVSKREVPQRQVPEPVTLLLLGGGLAGLAFRNRRAAVA